MKTKQILIIILFILSLVSCAQEQNGNKSNSTSTNSVHTSSNYIIEPSTKMEFVKISGGSFLMGDVFSTGESDELPLHEVFINDFYISKYEVTIKQWYTIIDNSFLSEDTTSYYDFPIIFVSWNEVLSYINKLNSMSSYYVFRLPTEAEWEYAARGKNKDLEYATSTGGVSYDLANYENFVTNKVGSYSSNSYGLFDMSGNVWEWCSDWYDKDYYTYSVVSNPKGAIIGEYKVVRGGSWYDDYFNLRTTNRQYFSPDQRHDNTGFRLVLIIK